MERWNLGDAGAAGRVFRYPRVFIRAIPCRMVQEMPCPMTGSRKLRLTGGTVPAGRQLKHLTSLTICAASICVTIPASLCLTRLCLCATYKLCLHFDSAEESARHLQAFDITCLYLLHQEPIKALQVHSAILSRCHSCNQSLQSRISESVSLCLPLIAQAMCIVKWVPVKNPASEWQ